MRSSVVPTNLPLQASSRPRRNDRGRESGRSGATSWNGTSFEHKGFTLWFTGLSGAGKSTVARILEQRLRALGTRVEVLDGDVVRTNLSKGLGFSKEDRDTNIRRIGFVCQLLSRNGVVAIAAAISPYRETRDFVRAGTENFVEVYARCPLAKLVERDVKGLYKKALAGEIKEFTGVSDPYEEPLEPEVIIDTHLETPDQSADKIWAKLEELGLISTGVHDRPAFAYEQVGRQPGARRAD